MNQYWFWWCLGMALILLPKLGVYLSRSDPFQYSFPVKTLMFFGGGTQDKFIDPAILSTSILSILAELALGSIYVNSLPVPYGYLGEMPKDSVLCVFFGAASEGIAPWFIKKLNGFFQGGAQ